MNIFEKLREEHDKARTLMDLVSKTHGDSTGRRELFTKVKKELEVHATAEEISLYKPLIGTAVQERAAHSFKEHEEMRELLDKLEQMDFSSSAWIQHFEKLQEMVLHHMDEEEHELFQQAGRALDDGQKETLSTTHERERAQLL